MSRGVGVIVTHHAKERIAQRADGGGNKTRDYGSMIFREVHHALEAGRISKRRPRWATYQDRKKSLGTWHVWNEEETHCYVLTKRNRGKQLTREDEFSTSWVVLTAITREHTDLVHRRGDQIRSGLLEG